MYVATVMALTGFVLQIFKSPLFETKRGVQTPTSAGLVKKPHSQTAAQSSEHNSPTAGCNIQIDIC